MLHNLDRLITDNLTSYLIQTLLNEGDEALDGIFLGNVLFDALLVLVERDLASGSADIAVISICHLAGTVHDATHDANLEGAVASIGLGFLLHGGLNAADGVLQVVKCASAARTGDVLRLVHLYASRLQNALCHGNLTFWLFAEADANRVADAIDE